MTDPDYSPAYQDEYQRLWHEAAARAEAAEAELADAKERVAFLVAEAHGWQPRLEAALAERDEARLERDAIQDKFDHLESEWIIGRDRGDSVVYRHEREAFDKWQRGALEADNARLRARLADADEIIDDCWHQFAIDIRGKLSPGGLSTLEMVDDYRNERDGAALAEGTP